MYSPEQIQAAMRAAAAAGDKEALADLRARLTESYAAEAPKATEGMSGVEKFAAGMGQGAVNLGRNVANIAHLPGFSDEDLAEAKQRDAALLATGAGRAGSIAGEILATAPVGGLTAGAGRLAATKLGGRYGSQALARLAATGGGQGAVEGFLTADPGSRASGAAFGAAGGQFLPQLAGAVGRRFTRGVDPNAAAKSLMRQGVDLTPGQMNRGSTMAQFEEVGSRLPFIGPHIQ